MGERILVVGGYGAVGRVIVAHLAERHQGGIIVAGRSYEKALAMVEHSTEHLLPLRLDLTTAHEDPALLNDVAAVVMGVDVPDLRFVRRCLERGVHYVDITASDEILRAIEGLDDVARAAGSTAVLSVGLAPGVTNLLAAQAQRDFDRLERVDMQGLLGLGEAHGAAAARWTMRNLNASYTVCEDGRRRTVQSFGAWQWAEFPAGLGRRRVYRFNLADQHVVTRTLQLPAASSWLTFDPASTTRLLALLQRTGLARLLRFRVVEEASVRLSLFMRAGSRAFAGQVVARGEMGGRQRTRTYSVHGDGQGRATGVVAAQVTGDLLEAEFPAGVFHSEQLFEPRPFIRRLASAGIEYVEKESAG